MTYQKILLENWDSLKEYIKNMDVKSASECLQLIRKKEDLNKYSQRWTLPCRLFNSTCHKCLWRMFFFQVNDKTDYDQHWHKKNLIV